MSEAIKPIAALWAGPDCRLFSMRMAGVDPLQSLMLTLCEWLQPAKTSPLTKYTTHSFGW